MTDRDRQINVLAELLENLDDLPFYTYKDEAEYLIDEYGVIVPPCKVGDKVFVVSQGQGFCMRWNVYEGKVVDIHLNRHNKLTIRVENGEKFFGYYEPCFVFLTKEEAEAELEKRGKEND